MLRRFLVWFLAPLTWPPRAALTVLLASAATGEAAETPAPHFPIVEYRVLGNTVLDAVDIERAVYPYLGEDKTFADVEHAREALEAAFRAHDFGTVFVDIPEQDVADGVVRLKVTEGRLRVARIEGARYFSEKKLLAAIPAAKAGSVPKLGELQAEIAEVNNQSADRSVVPVLKAGPVPGTVDLSLAVDDHLPLKLTAELNNQYTVGTSHLRGSVSVDYADLFGALDDLQAQYQWTPQKPSEVSVFVASYTSRPLAHGLKWAVTYVHSGSSVPTVGALGVLGKGDIWSGRLTLPVAFTQLTTQSIYLGVDYKNFLETINVDKTTSLVTPIHYLNLTGGFSGVWREPSRIWTLNVGANAGARGVVNDPASFENKRYLAPANYFYLREDASVAQTLPRDFVLHLRLAGQYTLDPLITNENFAIAGADGVRGYLETEELGDSALKGTLQLDTPTWKARDWLSGKLFVFYDAAGMHVVDPLPGQVPHVFLKSTGTGLDLVGTSHVTGSLTWTHALADALATRRSESRWLFVLRGTF